MLNKLKKETPSPIQSDTESKRKTPCSVRGLRCLAKQIHKDQAQLNKDTALLIRASEKLAAEKEILLHQNKALSKTLVEEKRRRKRGKAMGLLDKDRQPGEAQFFSPARVAAVRERAHEIEVENHRQKAIANDMRLQKAI